MYTIKFDTGHKRESVNDYRLCPVFVIAPLQSHPGVPRQGRPQVLPGWKRMSQWRNTSMVKASSRHAQRGRRRGLHESSSPGGGSLFGRGEPVGEIRVGTVRLCALA